MVRCYSVWRRFSSWHCPAALVCVGLFTWACGSTVKSQATKTAAVKPPSVAPNAVPNPPSPPPPDPVLTLIDTSEQHFQAGRKALDEGHVESAKQEFNLAIGVLVESPYGARTEPRIREHFDRLVDRISAYEMKALADGDGFTEKKYEPASIDELLALSTTFDKPAPTEEFQAAVKTDLETAGHDIPIPLNQRVLTYVELFQGRLHDYIDEGLQRGSKYLPMIQDVFRAEGLPLDLAYVPLIESAFKPNALSHAKAKGVWQFMRGTALENGLRHDWYIDERSDPEKATIAAAKYLHTLNRLFSGDWQLALASYNGGPGRVQRAIKKSHLSDFWALSAKPRLLPRETREYVPMILAAIVIARNPAQYGFTLDTAAVAKASDAPYDTVTLPRAVDLRRIAEWTDTTIDEIQTLNPELRRWTTPVRDSKYELKVPSGKGRVVEAKLSEVEADDLASLKWYTVRRGDTLQVIARKLNVNRTDLAEANYLSVKSRVAPGQKLMVPHEATVLMAAQTERSVPVAEARSTAARSTELTSGAAPSNRVKTTYTVRRGDTLAKVARLFRTSVASLRSWNRIPGDQITPGERLTVYRLAN